MAGKYNKYKQDGNHLRFPIRMILATVDLQVTWILPMNFESTALLVQEKKFKTDFQDGHHLGFPIRTIWAIFDLQVTTMLPTKFRVNWPFGSGEEAKNRFSRWPPSWFSDQNYFSYSWSTNHPDASYQLTLRFRKRSKKKKFQDGHHGGHFGFPIGMILAIFDLQVTPMLPTKFRVNWPFGSGGAKNRFSKWQPRRPSWISDRQDFS